MTIKQFIEKSIKGGWNTDLKFSEISDIYETEKGINFVSAFNTDVVAIRSIEKILLDPDLWRCAGKEMGWEDCRCEQCHDVFPEYHNGCVRCGNSIRKDIYNRYHQHLLIDHLATEKSIESFFESL